MSDTFLPIYGRNDVVDLSNVSLVPLNERKVDSRELMVL